jgi:hypothetical protein
LQYIAKNETIETMELSEDSIIAPIENSTKNNDTLFKQETLSDKEKHMQALTLLTELSIIANELCFNPDSNIKDTVGDRITIKQLVADDEGIIDREQTRIEVSPEIANQILYSLNMIGPSLQRQQEQARQTDIEDNRNKLKKDLRTVLIQGLFGKKVAAERVEETAREWSKNAGSWVSTMQRDITEFTRTIHTQDNRTFSLHQLEKTRRLLEINVKTAHNMTDKDLKKITEQIQQKYNIPGDE